MIDLNRLFQNWFADPEFSVVEKLAFADDTRARLSQHNTDGVFDSILVALDQDLEAAGGSTSTEAVGVAVRMAAVRAKRALLEEIRVLASRRSGRIVDAYGKGSTEYKEFFPRGLSAIREMTETEVATELQVIIAAAKKYDAELHTEFAELETKWIKVKKSAGDQVGAVASKSLSQELAMGKLELTLMKVLFTAALAYTGDTVMGPVLFDQSRLYNPKRASTEEPAQENAEVLAV